VTAANDRGIWASDLSGELQLIVREGDQLEASPGDWRTISALGGVVSVGDRVGRARVFNDSGQLGFSATFTDGSWGMFVSDAVARRSGDFDGDGTVDGEDLTVWRQSFGAAGDGLAADDDRDGDVDGADLLAWQRSLGQGSAAASLQLVPEPSGLVLALVVAVGVSAGRFKQQGS
jgi:hypothetical protein